MRTMLRKRSLASESTYTKNLFILGLCYIVGAIAAYVMYLITKELGGNLPDVNCTYAEFLWYHGKYVFFAFVCSYTAFGVLLLPVLMAAQGYAICCAVLTAALLLEKDIAVSMAIRHGPCSLVALICLFVISGHGFSSAQSTLAKRLGRRGGGIDPRFQSLQFVRFVVCSVFIMVVCAVCVVVAPYFL